MLNDLNAPGHRAPDIREEPPHYSAQAYIGLNNYIPTEYPIARLAISAVLGGIGLTHGGSYGKKLLTFLEPQNSQASFLLSRGQTDILYTAKPNNLIGALDLAGEEWRWMNHAAETTWRFYRGMYDHGGFI